MITYPVTMPQFAPDAVKNTFYWTETLADGTVGTEQSVDFTTSGATGSLTVTEGSNVVYSATQADKAGNVSARSAVGTITNASDTVPPAAPASPTTGPGDTAVPSAPALKKGVRTK